MKVWALAAMIAVVVVAAVAFGFNGSDNGDEPGRPAPHSLDQSN